MAGKRPAGGRYSFLICAFVGGTPTSRRELDIDRLEIAWRGTVFALYLAEDKIETEVVENMRS